MPHFIIVLFSNERKWQGTPRNYLKIKNIVKKLLKLWKYVFFRNWLFTLFHFEGLYFGKFLGWRMNLGLLEFIKLSHLAKKFKFRPLSPDSMVFQIFSYICMGTNLLCIFELEYKIYQKFVWKHFNLITVYIEVKINDFVHWNHRTLKKLRINF